MRIFFDKLLGFFGKAYIRWPLVLVFVLTLPWTIVLIPFYGPNDYTYYQLNLWLMLSVAAIGLNLLTGLTGMISLGHSAIFAVGAYVAAYFSSKAGWPFPISIITAAIFAGVIGLVLGLPALRLSGPYLAVATFSFAIAIPQLLNNSKEVGSLFGDPNDITFKLGVIKVAKQTFPGFEVKSDFGRYFLFLVIFAVMTLLAVGLWRSRTGRSFKAIRDSETAAQAMGINIGRYKLLAYIISAMYAGVAGAMYTAQVGQIQPLDGQFSSTEAIIFLTAIILGGLGSITGAVIGSGVLTILPAATQALNNLYRDTIGNGSKIENFESIFYGLIIVICIYFMPNGLVGAFKSLGNFLRGVKKEQETPEQLVLDSSLPIPDEIVGETAKGVKS